jgi:hypothetical protein
VVDDLADGEGLGRKATILMRWQQQQQQQQVG